MIKFFRKIRQNLLMENKTGKYFKYAIGEIVLVVLGILIALSINDWNDNRKNRLDEKKYVNDLIQDLKNDDIALKRLTVFLESKLASKIKIEPFLQGNYVEIDSIEIHFARQYAGDGRFTPTNITIEELKNSGGLRIIRDDVLRRQIVSLYTSYSNEVFTEDTFDSQNGKLLDIAAAYFKNVIEPTKDEIYIALEDNNYVNGIYANFTQTRKGAISDLHTQCLNLIENLEKYKNQIDD
jgi:hypothetical protein